MFSAVVEMHVSKHIQLSEVRRHKVRRKFRRPVRHSRKGNTTISVDLFKIINKKKPSISHHSFDHELIQFQQSRIQSFIFHVFILNTSLPQIPSPGNHALLWEQLFTVDDDDDLIFRRCSLSAPRSRLGMFFFPLASCLCSMFV